MDDGTEPVVQGDDLKAVAAEVAELVNGCDFATRPQRVVLMNDDQSDGQELEVHWSLELVDPRPTTN
jgi:hypothetical protein